MSSITKIVCAVDLSDRSAAVAEFAITVAQAFQAEIYVVYVAPEFHQYMSFGIAPESISQLSLDFSTSAQASLKSFFEQTFSNCMSSGCTVTMTLLTGYPSSEIVDFAKENCADLIVMGTHGHQGLSRVLFGSVAEGVVKNAPMPVLTIRPPEQ